MPLKKKSKPAGTKQPTSPRSMSVRMKLAGPTPKRKQQQVDSKMQRSSLIFDERDYEDDLHHDVYEDLLIELSLEESVPENHIISEDAQTEPKPACPAELNSSFDEWTFLGDDIKDTSFEDLSTDLSMHDNSLAMYTEFLNVFLRSDTPELFSGACLSTQNWTGVRAVDKFAHRGGDLHTAFSVVHSWVKAKDSNKDLDIKAWSKQNGINGQSLRRIVQSLNSYTKQIIDLGKNDMKCQFEGLTLQICHQFKSQTCYFLGHPDAGYKKLENGEVLPCCFSSTIRVLDHLPKYAICIPWHCHTGGQMCQYVVPLQEDVAAKLIEESFPDFTEEEFALYRVMEVPNTITIDDCESELLVRNWFSDKVQYYLNVRSNGKIELYARAAENENAKKYLEEKMNQLKNCMGEKTKSFNFPPNHEGIRLLITEGAKCEQVQFDTDFMLDQPDEAQVATVSVKFVVSIVFKEVILKKLSENKDDVENKCQEYIADKLNDLSKRSYVIQAPDEQSDDNITLQIVFYNSVAAKRGLMFLREDQDITIENEKSISLQMRSCELLIQKDLMSVIGEKLHKTLDMLRHSTMYNSHYSITDDVTSPHIVFKISVQDSLQLSRATDILERCIKPLVLKLSKPTVMKQQLLGASIMNMIGRLTGTFVHIPCNADEVHIYGEHDAEKNSFEMISAYLKNCDKMWKCIGTLNIADTELPNDITALIHQVVSRKKGKLADPLYIDMKNKDFWLLTEESHFSESLHKVKELLVKILANEYNIHVSVDSVKFKEQVGLRLECVACYTEITHKPYIVEACRHSYCAECLLTEIKTAIKSSHLPIACAECDAHFSITDIGKVMSSIGTLKQKKLLKCSLNNFITSHNELFRFCPMPDCDGIFKKSELVCVLCLANICGKCFDCAHDKMSCEQFKEIGKWLREDPQNRKTCPNCCVVIEKNGGCNNVICAHCKKNMCWFCLKFFETSNECYSHMDAREHWN